MSGKFDASPSALISLNTMIRTTVAKPCYKRLLPRFLSPSTKFLAKSDPSLEQELPSIGKAVSIMEESDFMGPIVQSIVILLGAY